MKSLKNKKGFTIVELVIVIAVIAILAAVMIPTFSNIVDNAKKSAAMQEAKNAYTNWLADKSDNIETASKNTIHIKSDDYCFHVTNGQFDSEAHSDCSEGNDIKAEVSGDTLVSRS